MANFNFNPPTGLQDVASYPTNPGTEAAAREQIQRGMNQIKDYINSSLTDKNLDFVNSKTGNGYTKLPNGLIIQWGYFMRTGADARTFEIYPTYPISFTNVCFSFVCNIGVQDSFTNTRACDYYGISGGLSSFKIRAYATGDYANTVESAFVNWVAIGY